MPFPTDPPLPTRTAAEQQAAVTERRCQLAALVKLDEPISFARRVELAAQLDASPTTIFRDLEALRAATRPARRVAVDLYTPPPDLAERDAVLLRMLGHLKLARADWIADLLYPDHPAAAVKRHLDTLRARGLLWATRQRVAPSIRGSERRVAPPPNLPVLYGLTPAGKEHLRQENQLPEFHHASRLHTLAPRTRLLPPDQLQRDMQRVSWCVAILAAARRCVLLDAAFAQVEPVLQERWRTVTTSRGEKENRREVDLEADALVILRFQEKMAARRPGDPLPWLTSSFKQLKQPGARALAFALHVDSGWSETDAARLSARYRDLYHEPFRSSQPIDPERQVLPVPVILTTSYERIRLIAGAWNSAWVVRGPGTGGSPPLEQVLSSKGLISCPPHTEDPTWGALWGWHLPLQKFRESSTPGPRQLLDELFETLKVWEEWCPGVGAR
jgi:hypothetical protein